MKIGNIKAQPGEKAFGYLPTGAARSGLKPDIPIHVITGTKPGPTLLVQGAIHGGEVPGAIAVLNFIKSVDPQGMRGSVIAVPVVNRAGFELGERGSRIDNKDISRLFPGKKDGSISEQIAYHYFKEVISKANVLVDFHAGARTAYERYVLFSADGDPDNLTEIEKKRHKLVVAFGLDQAAFFPPGTFGSNLSKVAIEEVGVVQITLEFGGGTGWYKNGLDNVRDAERGIFNIMKSMGMIDGEFESDGELCTIYNAGTVIWKPNVDGLFQRKRGFREELQEGDIYASLLDPYTGETLADMRSPRYGIVIPSGQEWPTIGATSVGILGTIDRVEDRRTMDLTVSF